ncbi:hypothetical protein SK128_028516, partial [Halocaridina rubra]
MEASTYKSSRSLSSVDASADVKGHNATFSSYCDNMVFHEHQGKSTGGKSITMVLHLMNLPTSMNGGVFNSSHLYGKIAKIHYNPSTDDGDIMINSCTKAAARNGFNSHDNSTWNLHVEFISFEKFSLGLSQAVSENDLYYSVTVHRETYSRTKDAPL